jgi:kumamolisin
VIVRPQKEISDQEVIQATTGIPSLRMLPEREAFFAEHGSSDDDMQALRTHFEGAGLRVETDDARRAIVLQGNVEQFAEAFGTELQMMREAETGREYIGRHGRLQLPRDLADLVVGVFGLDARRQARPRLVRRPSDVATVSVLALGGGAHTPSALGRYYNFPVANGSGQTIAVLEFGGGYLESDLSTYFKSLGSAAPDVVSVGLDGVQNDPSGEGQQDADGEVTLDIEVVGAIAPGATIVVYFAPFTERGWVDAVTTAVHSKTHPADIISISWGFTEGDLIWTPAALTVVNHAFKAAAAVGVSVFVASGDDGAADEQSDGQRHVDFPASSPYVTGVGGTTLTASGEVVWNNGPRGQGGGASGGGVSTVFGLPTYQQGANVPPRPNGGAGRGVPDVAADADPNTGYRILLDGQRVTIGGTSAAAPLWAGLTARLNQRLGAKVGFLNPLLYSHLGPAAALRDVMHGGNDTTGRLGGYAAGVGWDATTGWGTPDGGRILAALGGQTTSLDFGVRGWEAVPGLARDISVSGDREAPALWAVSGIPGPNGYVVVQWNGEAWTPEDHSAMRVNARAGDGRPVTVDVWGHVAAKAEDGWERLPGWRIIDVARSEDGTVWALGWPAPDSPESAGMPGWQLDYPLMSFAEGEWQREGRSGVRVEVGPEGTLALVSAAGVVSWRDDGEWMELPGRASDVSIGSDGTLYAVGWDGIAYEWNGSAWLPIAPALTVAAGPNRSLWMIAAGGTIVRAIKEQARLAGASAEGQ